MTKLHRKELKQDEIRETIVDAVKSVSIHGRQLAYIIGVVLLVALIAFGWFFYEQKQKEASQNVLGIALEKFNTAVGEPEAPNAPKPAYTFKTDSEKYKAALKDFEKVINEYGNTQAADQARYMAGVCSFYLNDLPKTEKYLKESGKVSERNILYYQSRLALADLYMKTGKPDQSVQILKEATEKRNPPVPSEYLLFKLAESYDKLGKKKEARETYQKIVDQYKESSLVFQAQSRLSEQGK
jgi:tetratricopeptide (TPR) repeat protein